MWYPRTSFETSGLTDFSFSWPRQAVLSFDDWALSLRSQRLRKKHCDHMSSSRILLCGIRLSTSQPKLARTARAVTRDPIVSKLLSRFAIRIEQSAPCMNASRRVHVVYPGAHKPANRFFFRQSTQIRFLVRYWLFMCLPGRTTRKPEAWSGAVVVTIFTEVTATILASTVIAKASASCARGAWSTKSKQPGDGRGGNSTGLSFY